MEEKKARLRRRHSTELRMNSRLGSETYSKLEECARKSETLPWSDYISLLLCGTRDEGSPLRYLLGLESTLIRGIYEIFVESLREKISLTPPAQAVARFRDPSERENISESNFDIVEKRESTIPVASYLLGSSSAEMGEVIPHRLLGNRVRDRPMVAFVQCNRVEFPCPMDRNVNMLPFVLGDKESLPSHLQPYYDLISSCPLNSNEMGKVCYLTVCESFVKAGETQRRPGLHVEAPASSMLKGANGSFTAAWEHHWGMGEAYTEDELKGGLFVASNMDLTCEIWDALIAPACGITDSQGGVEHLRPFLGKGKKLRAGELAWLTDRTPHQACPQRRDGYRQFFRLVTSNVSLWFEEHSTSNPKVPLPKHVKVIKGSKFDKDYPLIKGRQSDG
uniref:Uncharacterized protein n=1 Tax=Odontella aurita TaxID=265563 RepID=A0A7S4JTQ8_9STRA|mmetsp:Transcript_53938/g.161433  ORF Transcript_53938/g.161433 Transcript_53938/m.161433 type:complete len:392 (+) Transcript_53938:271-1446(+)|eukprot:CAMPEP_0113534004 /NCGR_PEP_ID=MMETSP0015_2-20120614/4926_1 /TAXON_ID=2838 /ORGANISM="Odontella" /LENGTH=391 /DNA_ID=CAMNT_0000433133 /DNA_START=214 /DNA_END=1389 /DNA_ORIENTATION=- /assembly_acc=CAM_ASM_000160